MKAALVLDEEADLTSMTEEYLPKVTFVARKGRKDPVAIYPKGTVFEGEHAVLLVQNGQAQPIDDECAKACGMSTGAIAAQQVEYQMASLGINSKKDKDLYRGGVILGYDENLKYIPGPNWDAYQAAIKAEDAKDDI